MNILVINGSPKGEKNTIISALVGLLIMAINLKISHILMNRVTKKHD